MFELLMNSPKKVEVWTSLLDYNGGTRHYIANGIIGDKLYVYAGYQITGMQAYDFLTNTWTTGLPTGPTQGYKNGGCTLDGKFYIIEDAQLRLWSYAPGGAWSYVAIPSGVGVRSNAVMIGVGGKLYVLGGGSATVWSYTPGTNTWVQLASGPENVTEAIIFEHNGYIYLVGGVAGPITISTFTNKVWCYDIVGNSWVRKADIPKTLGQHKGGVVNGVLYTYGGYFNESYFAKYDIAADVWTVLPTPVTGVDSRRGGVGVVYNGEIYWYAGYGSSGFWKYRPAI